MSLRSTTGCYTCKSRKKKCDETHPKCQRCIRSGIECGGYAPLDSPDNKGVMRRVRAVPITSESSNNTERLSQVVSSHSAGSSRLRKIMLSRPPPTRDQVNPNTSDRYRDSQDHADVPLNTQSGSSLLPDHPSGHPNLASSLHSARITSFLSSDLAQFPNSSVGGQSANSSLPVGQQAASSSGSSFGKSASTRSSSSRSSSDLSRRYSSNIRPTNPPVFLTSGQANLFQALFSLAGPETDLPGSDLWSPVDPESHITYGPNWPPPNLSVQAGYERPDAIDDDDPEGIKQIMCKTLTPDPNTQNNALPFVLQCYASWVNFTVFEPLKVVHSMRNNIITQFSSSQESRTRFILISNVIGTLGKNPQLNAKGLSFVALLQTEAHRAIERFCSKRPTGQRDIDMQEASKTLGRMIEVIPIQHFSSSLSTVFKLMQAAAPVFRRGCPESPDQLVNLPNILFEPGLNLRHFAAADVLMSVTNARPMFFKYDVTCTPEIADRMTNADLGLQWSHGVPDHVIILLAWINVLCEDLGNNADPQYVLDIEDQIRSIKVVPTAVPGDPFTAVWRLAVQECWRQAVYIYLYMALCGARADEPRVLSAVRAFTRIVDGVKPGRNPDSFLFTPIMIVGTAAFEVRDRNILRRRMLGLQECKTPGTCGSDCLLILVDIWERTDTEKRAAVWHDLRIACHKVAGV